MSAALVLLTGCNETGDTEEGQWFCYEGGEQQVRLYLELKNGKADLIITAWGDRYQGPYTYNADNGELVIKYDKYLARYVAMEEPDKAVLVSNLFNDWPGPTSADHVDLSSPITMVFTINGDKALCEFVGLNMEMSRKK